MTADMTVPAAPLPVPRHARFALLGPQTPHLLSIEAALQAGGWVFRHHLLADALDRSDRLDADLVVVSCSLHDLLVLAPRLSAALGGVVVVCSMVDERQQDAYDNPRVGPRTSAVAQVAAALPTARVVGALQQFSASHFTLISLGVLDTDAPVTGDDAEAVDLVEAVLDQIPGVEAVFAGPIRNASAVEGIAAILRSLEQDAGRPLGFRLDPMRGLVILYGAG